MVLQRIDRVIQHRWVIVGCIVWLMAMLGMGQALQHQAVQWLFRISPVMTEWTAAKVARDGNDVLVSGTVVKRWQCEYLAPPIAETITGAPLETQTHSLLPQRMWPADGRPRDFGPWRIKNAAGMRFRLYYHHECFGVDVLTFLGHIDATDLSEPKT